MDDTTKLLHEGEYLRLLRHDTWEYAERVRGTRAVIIVAVTPERKLLFVEQYRVPLRARAIELPAGLVGDTHDDDTLEAAARRELLEETGWEAGEVRVLMAGPTSAGMSNEIIAFVRATDLRRRHAGGGDESEDITVHEIPVADAPRWLAARIADGLAMDPKIWAGLYLVDRDPDGSAA